MEVTDLTRAELERLMPGRPLRTYPAILSTEADALAWARQGAADGSLVVAGYQAAPRGRAGLSFADDFDSGHGLGCTFVLRPDLENEREGWLYAVGVLALADAVGDEPGRTIEWPDRVVEGERTIGAVGVQTEPGAKTLRWAVVTLLVPGSEPPRAPLLARLADGIDRWSAASVEEVRQAFHDRCGTFGRHVRARLLPLGPAAPTFEGTAVDLAPDGGLVIETADERRVVVQAQTLGFLEDPDKDLRGPPGFGGG